MIRELFQALGTLPSFKDRLKSIVTAGAILYAVNLSILAEMPSGPLDLVVSSDASRLAILSWLHSNSSGESLGCEVARNSAKWIGACDLLEQEAKKSLRPRLFLCTCGQWNHLKLVEGL